MLLQFYIIWWWLDLDSQSIQHFRVRFLRDILYQTVELGRTSRVSSFFFFFWPMLCGSCCFPFLSLQYCSCCSKSGADCDFMLLLCQPAADITLRRSTRKRRVLLHVDYASDNTDPKGTEVRVCSFASHVCHYSLLAGLLLVC
jgi:hypothetical protein